jgi:hypothetical protein
LQRAERSHFPTRRTKPIAPNEAIGKMGEAPDEAIGDLGNLRRSRTAQCLLAPNEAILDRAERSQFAQQVR